MIGSGLDVVGLQNLCQLLHLLTRQTVDDTALAGMLLDELDDVLINILRLRTYLVIQVRTVERTLELLGIHDTQILLDIRTDLIRCRRRQGNDGCLTDFIDDRTDATILRTEVMTPLRDTMGLVNGVERDLRLLQEFHILVLGQRLGSHIEQLGLTIQDIGLHLIDSRLVQRRVQVMGRTFVTHRADDIHLILHQGYQRRDDNSRTVH